MDAAMLSMLNTMVDDEPEAMGLNVDAKPFVPSYMQPKPSTQPSVSSTATSPAALPMMAQEMPPAMPGYFMDAYGNMYTGMNAAGNMYADHYVDPHTAQMLAHEDYLRDNLYQTPQQPKGNTYGRARNQQARWGRA